MSIDQTSLNKQLCPAIEVDKVFFSYGGPLVLEDVTFQIPRQDFASLVGPNGGGKTTLVKIILGLLTPSKGAVRILGDSPREGRKRVGYVSQRPHFDPLFPVSVLDVVSMGRIRSGLPWGFLRTNEKQQAMVCLEEVALSDAAGKSFSALSGGQQQRVLIARALACNPDILLLDEPTSNLDIHMEEAFYELLVHLNQRMTVVLVSHDLGFVSRFVKTVVCVKQKVMVHPTSEIDSGVIREMYGDEIRVIRHDVDCGHFHGSMM